MVKQSIAITFEDGELNAFLSPIRLPRPYEEYATIGISFI